MKKIIVTLILIGCSIINCQGQIQGMSLDFGFGINPITSKSSYQNSAGAGLSLYLNSYYYFKSKFAVGVEFLTSSSMMSGNAPYIDIQTTGINAILLGGRYHVQRRNGYFFFGIKAGRYKIKCEGTSVDLFLFLPYNVEEFLFEERNVFGLAPEIGRTFGHFQLAFCSHFPAIYNASLKGPSRSNLNISSKYRLYQIRIGISLYSKKKITN